MGRFGRGDGDLSPVREGQVTEYPDNPDLPAANRKAECGKFIDCHLSGCFGCPGPPENEPSVLDVRCPKCSSRAVTVRKKDGSKWCHACDAYYSPDYLGFTKQFRVWLW